MPTKKMEAWGADKPFANMKENNLTAKSIALTVSSRKINCKRIVFILDCRPRFEIRQNALKNSRSKKSYKICFPSPFRPSPWSSQTFCRTGENFFLFISIYSAKSLFFLLFSSSKCCDACSGELVPVLLCFRSLATELEFQREPGEWITDKIVWHVRWLCIFRADLFALLRYLVGFRAIETCTS